MNRTSRSAVSRSHDTRSVIQYGRPDTTSMPCLPVHGLERREAHGGDFAKVERRREAREHLRAQRGHDILVGRRRREHDDLHARTDDPELGGERQVLGD